MVAVQRHLGRRARPAQNLLFGFWRTHAKSRHKRQRKQEQPTTNFLGGIVANAMAQPKTKLPEFMIEDTTLHKRHPLAAAALRIAHIG
jgi:hypothetical protein